MLPLIFLHRCRSLKNVGSIIVVDFHTNVKMFVILPQGEHMYKHSQLLYMLPIARIIKYQVDKRLHSCFFTDLDSWLFFLFNKISGWLSCHSFRLSMLFSLGLPVPLFLVIFFFCCYNVFRSSSLYAPVSIARTVESEDLSVKNFQDKIFEIKLSIWGLFVFLLSSEYRREWSPEDF